jgi:tetratricopeptide (TPR) repeat protein
MLASIYAQEGDGVAARRAFDKAIKNAISKAESQEYELAMAAFLLERQDVAAAQAIVDRILEEVPKRTPLYDQAAELAGRLLVYNSDGN